MTRAASKPESRRSAYSVMRKNHCSRRLRDDLGAAALAAPVDHLLVGEHRLVVGAPLDRRLGAVGEAALEHLEEDPLRPAVVVGLVGRDLARPVDRDAPAAELLAEGLDRLLGRDARVLAGADRVVLGREAEGVVAHRVDDLEAVAAPEVRDRVADRVALQVADVGLARGVRAASRARSSWASSRRTRGRRGSAPPRCARPPTRPATCARSARRRTAPSRAV